VVLPLDVTDADAVRSPSTISPRPRADRLLFNNAGINSAPAPIDEIAVEDWLTVGRNVNLTGMFLCARAAFAQMRRQDPQGGRIINNGSISAHVPRWGSTPYTMTKHAITGLTRTLSLDGRPSTSPAGRSTSATPMAHVADAVLAMAELPLSANILFQTIMATKMPYVGRG
jgi:NAD(P)-dependent dehydrogenase (short-subunit alcohol dehydrogenase family)